MVHPGKHEFCERSIRDSTSSYPINGSSHTLQVLDIVSLVLEKYAHSIPLKKFFKYPCCFPGTDVPAFTHSVFVSRNTEILQKYNATQCETCSSWKRKNFCLCVGPCFQGKTTLHLQGLWIHIKLDQILAQAESCHFSHCLAGQRCCCSLWRSRFAVVHIWRSPFMWPLGWGGWKSCGHNQLVPLVWCLQLSVEPWGIAAGLHSAEPHVGNHRSAGLTVYWCRPLKVGLCVCVQIYARSINCCLTTS